MKTILLFVLMLLPDYKYAWTDTEKRSGKIEILSIERVQNKRNDILIHFKIPIKDELIPDYLSVRPIWIPKNESVPERKGKIQKTWIVGNQSSISLFNRRHGFAFYQGHIRLHYPNLSESVHFTGMVIHPDAIWIDWTGRRGDAIIINIRKLPRFTPGVLSSARLALYESSYSRVENGNSF